MTDEQKRPNTIERHIQTILLTLVTTALISVFSKVNTMNESLVRMEEREKSKTEQISAMQGVMNKMQLDVIDVKDRLTKLEAKQK